MQPWNFLPVSLSVAIAAESHTQYEKVLPSPYQRGAFDEFHKLGRFEGHDINHPEVIFAQLAGESRPLDLNT